VDGIIILVTITTTAQQQSDQVHDTTIADALRYSSSIMTTTTTPFTNCIAVTPSFLLSSSAPTQGFPTSTQTATTNHQQGGSYRYLGCFQDSTDTPMFTGNITVSESMTHKFCFDFCNGNHAKYFGVRQGYTQPGRSLDLCFCGDTGGFNARYQMGICNHPCGGDHSLVCGARNTFSVFQVLSSS